MHSDLTGFQEILLFLQIAEKILTNIRQLLYMLIILGDHLEYDQPMKKVMLNYI